MAPQWRMQCPNLGWLEKQQGAHINHRTEPLQLSVIIPLCSKNISQESGVATTETEFKKVENENKINVDSSKPWQGYFRESKHIILVAQWRPEKATNEGKRGIFILGKKKKKKDIFLLLMRNKF